MATNSGPGWTQGYKPTTAQWESEWESKVDGANGQADNLLINGGTIAGTIGAIGTAAIGGSLAVAGSFTLGASGQTIDLIGTVLANGNTLMTAANNIRTVAFTLIGEPPSGQAYFIPLTQAGTLLANGGTMAVSPGINPTATQTLVVSTEHAGTITARGTISISTGGSVTPPTFSNAAIAAGDSVGITNQATADATFANWSFGLQFKVT